MSIIAAFLLAKTASDAVRTTRNIASTARSVASTAEAISSMANSRKPQNQPVQQQVVYINAQQPVNAIPAPTVSNVVMNTYDIDLFYAKVAMLAFIAKADQEVSQDERTELNQILSVASSMYGNEVVSKALYIFDSECSSFMALEPYLRKVEDCDLDSFAFYADEFTKADARITAEESVAVQKIRSYIDSRKGKKEYVNLKCPNCGASLQIDAYGYKADCLYCGYEQILNIDNSPEKIATANKNACCASCGKVIANFKNSGGFAFCPYCGGDVNGTPRPAQQATGPVVVVQSKTNEPNLYISYNTTNPGVGMVTRIVTTGEKNTYVNGQTLSFHLSPGPQQIILKIGKKNYARDIVIPSNNSPVRIYGSFNGRAQISVDQPPY